MEFKKCNPEEARTLDVQTVVMQILSLFLLCDSCWNSICKRWTITEPESRAGL